MRVPSSTSTPNTIGSFLLKMCCGKIFTTAGNVAIVIAAQRGWNKWKAKHECEMARRYHRNQRSTRTFGAADTR